MSYSGPCFSHLINPVNAKKSSHRMFRHMHGVLNEVYLQNFLHRWDVNRETNLMSIPARRPRLLASCRRLPSAPPAPPRRLLADATGPAPPRPAPPSALAGAARPVSPKSPPARASSGRPAPTRMSAGVGSRLRQACPAPSPRMAGGGAEAGHAPHAGAVVRRSFGGASNLILCCYNTCL